MPELELSQGKIEYRDEGTGAPLVFIHGLLVNGRVWERLIPLLAPHARCIAPNLPLGSHRTPMNPSADLSPVGVAGLIAELIERLGLDQVTLVGNDTGGALCQLVCASGRVHDRIGRLVLTNCDAFQHFPPPSLKPLIVGLARVPGAVALLGAFGRLRFARRASMAAAGLTVDPVPDELVDEWVAPLRSRSVRRDLIKVLRGISSEHTLAAAERFAGFESPVLIAWGTRDRFFPVADAERLAGAFPNARLELIEGARTFVQLDAPARLAELIVEAVETAAPDREEVV